MIVADATGSYLRGKQIREVKSHVKAEVLIGVRGKKKIVIGVAVDRAYSDERKLLWRILDRVKVKAPHFLGDGYYDSVKLIEYLGKKRIKCVIAISETIRWGPTGGW